MCRKLGRDVANVGKRIQRPQRRFSESHYLPQIYQANKLKKMNLHQQQNRATRDRRDADKVLGES